MRKLTITTANGGKQPRIVAEAFLTLTFFVVDNATAYGTDKIDPHSPPGKPVTVDWVVHVLEGGGSPNMLVGCTLLGSQGIIPVSRVDKGVCTNRVHLKAGTLINTTITGPVMNAFVDRLHGGKSDCPGLHVYKPEAFRKLLERMTPVKNQSAFKAALPGDSGSSSGASASSQAYQGTADTMDRAAQRHYQLLDAYAPLLDDEGRDLDRRSGQTGDRKRRVTFSEQNDSTTRRRATRDATPRSALRTTPTSAALEYEELHDLLHNHTTTTSDVSPMSSSNSTDGSHYDDDL